jgi:hypothetical protein
MAMPVAPSTKVISQEKTWLPIDPAFSPGGDNSSVKLHGKQG